MNNTENVRNSFLEKRNGSVIANDIVPKWESLWMRTFKVTITILCLIGFCFNSFIIFKQFVGNETLTSHKIEQNLELFLPSITLCGPSGFKRAVKKYSEGRGQFLQAELQ